MIDLGRRNVVVQIDMEHTERILCWVHQITFLQKLDCLLFSSLCGSVCYLRGIRGDGDLALFTFPGMQERFNGLRQYWDFQNC